MCGFFVVLSSWIGDGWLVVGEALYIGLTDKGTPDMQGAVAGVTDALDIIA